MNEPTQTLARRSLIFCGICYWPNHPSADMHGRVHFCLRTKGTSAVILHLSKFGVRLLPAEFGYAWNISRSIVEAHLTELHYGELYVCALPLAYLDVRHYLPAPSALLLINLTRRAKQLTSPAAVAADVAGTENTANAVTAATDLLNRDRDRDRDRDKKGEGT